MIRCGKGAARVLMKARILLKADVSENGPGWSDQRISEALETSHPTVVRTRRQPVEEGLDAALSRKKSSWSPPRTFDGVAEAKLIALTCSEPPPGHARWTLKLLEKKVMELGIVEAASDTTIYRTLNKNEVEPHKSRYWVISPEACAAFVSAIKKVLEVYARLHGSARPLVCLDCSASPLMGTATSLSDTEARGNKPFS